MVLFLFTVNAPTKSNSLNLRHSLANISASSTNMVAQLGRTYPAGLPVNFGVSQPGTG